MLGSAYIFLVQYLSPIRLLNYRPLNSSGWSARVSEKGNKEINLYRFGEWFLVWLILVLTMKSDSLCSVAGRNDRNSKKICSQSYPASLIQAYLRPYMVIPASGVHHSHSGTSRGLFLEAPGSSTTQVLFPAFFSPGLHAQGFQYGWAANPSVNKNSLVLPSEWTWRCSLKWGDHFGTTLSYPGFLVCFCCTPLSSQIPSQALTHGQAKINSVASSLIIIRIKGGKHSTFISCVNALLLGMRMHMWYKVSWTKFYKFHCVTVSGSTCYKVSIQ